MKLTKQISPLWVIPVLLAGYASVAAAGTIGKGDAGTFGLILALAIIIGLYFNARQAARFPEENYSRVGLKIWRTIAVLLFVVAVVLAIMKGSN